MYADPTHIRDNVIKVRLNDPEYDVFMAMARLNERQPAVFLRELAFFAISLAEKSNGQSEMG